MSHEASKDSSTIELCWKVVHFGFVRILIAMGAGVIIASVLDPFDTYHLLGRVFSHPEGFAG